jgi:hypothetical protein
LRIGKSRGGSGRWSWPTGRSQRALGTWQWPRHPRLFLSSAHPLMETCRRSSSLGTHEQRADGGPRGVSADERSCTYVLRVGGRPQTPARAAGGAAGWLSPPNGPGGTGDSARCRCPSDDASPSRRIPGVAWRVQAALTGDGRSPAWVSDSDCRARRNGECAESLRVRHAATMWRS